MHLWPCLPGHAAKGVILVLLPNQSCQSQPTSSIASKSVMSGSEIVGDLMRICGSRFWQHCLTHWLQPGPPKVMSMFKFQPQHPLVCGMPTKPKTEKIRVSTHLYTNQNMSISLWNCSVRKRCWLRQLDIELALRERTEWPVIMTTEMHHFPFRAAHLRPLAFYHSWTAENRCSMKMACFVLIRITSQDLSNSTGRPGRHGAMWMMITSIEVRFSQKQYAVSI